MGKKNPNVTVQKINPKQPSILNFFTKTEKQQSNLFTHVTRPRASSVIPETPEFISVSGGQSALCINRVSPDCIPETPPSIAFAEGQPTVKSFGPLFQETGSAVSGARDGTIGGKSKLSRKYRLNKRATRELNNGTESSLDGDGAIKPSRVFLKKNSSKKRSCVNSKRSPNRGASPLAKRSQRDICDNSLPSVRKHLFSEIPQTSLENLENTLGVLPSSVSKTVDDRVDLIKVIQADKKENGDILARGNKKQHDLITQQSKHLVEERMVLSDTITEDTPRGINQTEIENRSSLDVSVEWDDLNESLLAALDEAALDEAAQQQQYQSKQNIDVKYTSQFTTEQDTLVSRLAHLSPFKKDRESEDLLPPSLVRYRVKSAQMKGNGDQVLYVKNLASGTSQTCFVSGVWNQISYSEGDLLAIHGEWRESNQCHISQDRGFIVYKPDLLLTGTAVAGSIRCMRRSVFDNIFKGVDKGNKAMVLGTLIHEVFDKALRKKKFDDAYLQKFMADSLKIPSTRNKLYSMQLKPSELMKDGEEYFKPLQLWAKRYLRPSPAAEAHVGIKWPGTKMSVKCPLSIPKVCDIEDNMWCPRWGLKGKVDVTTQVRIHRKDQIMKRDRFVLPLELKTGRQTNSIEHHSQVMLYSLMMTDLDSQAPPLGLLLYLKTGALLSVTSSHMDKRELIHLRNQLAFNLSQSAKKGQDGQFQPPNLPAPIEDDFTCSRCCHITTCAIMNKVNPAPLSNTALEGFTQHMNHLSDSHIQYFIHWYTLCILEHEEIRKRNSTKDVWNKSVTEREKRGGCHGDLIVSHCKAEDSGVFLVTFRQRERSSPLKFELGDWLIVNDENTGQIAKLVGTVRSANPESITISTDSPLSTYPGNRSVYTLDKNESYDSMASSFINLAYLMSATTHRSRLRDIIIDLQTTPNSVSSVAMVSLSNGAKKVLSAMNEDQRSAITNVLQREEFSLIMGMPGTGKTTTVAALVQILVLEGKSVLLTSYTHSAVDNILLKLNEVGISFLRLGSTYRIHQRLHQYSEEVALRGCDVDDIANLIETMPVIAATSLGVKSPLLSRKRFDYCIIDEASQITQPVCLAPLFKASKFVMVGDHKQLPPLVQSSSARIAGMGESLFQRLAAGCPESVSELRLQYRMHPIIMDISNAFTYQGALRCGNEQVQRRNLELPHYTTKVSLPSWLQLAIEPETVVRFFSTEQLDIKEDENGLNHLEAKLVKMTVKHLIQYGCNPEEIGIIAPFRKQCSLLQTTMAEISKDVEVNTIDKYQGRDKTIIIISFTLQRQQGRPSILEDARRINVALTRAKKKMIMFGNGSVLRLTTCLARFMGILEQKGYVSLITDIENRLNNEVNVI